MCKPVRGTNGQHNSGRHEALPVNGWCAYGYETEMGSKRGKYATRRQVGNSDRAHARNSEQNATVRVILQALADSVSSTKLGTFKCLNARRGRSRQNEGGPEWEIDGKESKRDRPREWVHGRGP